MAGTTQPSQATKDEVELRELIARWSKAVRDEDLTGIRADHDPKILMFDVPPPFLSRGIDAYMATWQTFFASSAKPVVFDFEDVEITAGDDVAFARLSGIASTSSAMARRPTSSSASPWGSVSTMDDGVSFTNIIHCPP